jgi:GntR family transcriptional regulator
VVNKGSPVPLYHQVKDLLRSAIEEGKWSSDQQLPNETRLAEQFGVSKITIRQALQELADLGYIRREQGRGTFVSNPKFGQGPRELMGFSEEMARHQVAAGSRVLRKEVAVADPAVAENLKLLPAAEILLLERLRFANGEPVGIQTAHIPLSLAPGIADVDFENASLYDILEARYGLQPASASEQYQASAADARSAELLRIPAGASVFAAERVTVSPSGQPIEFTRSVMRGDRYRIVLNLVKSPAGTSTGHSALAIKL